MKDGSIRPRRLRQSASVRAWVAETRVHPSCLMMPYFVTEGSAQEVAMEAMPGIMRLSCDRLVRQVEDSMAYGLRNILLFGVPGRSHKDAMASAADAAGSVVAEAVRVLKKQFGQDILVATDVCLCSYTSHGHCGLLQEGDVANDATLPRLAAMAVAHAEAGADVVAPSDMMDGRVGWIRQALDAAHLQKTLIMSYCVKYASAYYGPFREAADCAPSQGDRRSYQMDSRNRREAMREARLDIQEGADVVMVKPALAYLDIISDIRSQTDMPVACYNVSGEYAMVKAAAAQGWIEEGRVVSENLHAMRRAGADMVITYHARDALKEGWLEWIG